MLMIQNLIYQWQLILKKLNNWFEELEIYFHAWIHVTWPGCVSELATQCGKKKKKQCPDIWLACNDKVNIILLLKKLQHFTSFNIVFSEEFLSYAAHKCCILRYPSSYAQVNTFVLSLLKLFSFFFSTNIYVHLLWCVMHSIFFLW